MVSALLAIYWDTDCVFSFVIEMNSMWSQLMIFCFKKTEFVLRQGQEVLFVLT